MRATSPAGLKAHVVHLAMIAFALWPLVHLGLVARYELSPWKLAGWGMYSTPRPDFYGMEIFYRREGEPAAARTKLGAPSADLRVAAEHFLNRHRWLRRLARPDALARAVFAGDAAVEELEVVVYRPEVDRRTATIALASISYRYRRPGVLTSSGSGSAASSAR